MKKKVIRNLKKNKKSNFFFDLKKNHFNIKSSDEEFSERKKIPEVYEFFFPDITLKEYKELQKSEEFKNASITVCDNCYVDLNAFRLSAGNDVINKYDTTYKVYGTGPLMPKMNNISNLLSQNKISDLNYAEKVLAKKIKYNEIPKTGQIYKLGSVNSTNDLDRSTNCINLFSPKSTLYSLKNKSKYKSIYESNKITEENNEKPNLQNYIEVYILFSKNNSL